MERGKIIADFLIVISALFLILVLNLPSIILQEFSKFLTLVSWDENNLLLTVIAEITTITAITVISVIIVKMAIRIRRQIITLSSIESDAETAADIERKAASVGLDAGRRFKETVNLEIDKAIDEFKEDADNKIDQRLDSLISERFGDKITEGLGKQVAEQAEIYASQRTLDEYLLKAKKGSNDRALDYANGSHRQAERIRSFAIWLSILGLIVAISTVVMTLFSAEPSNGKNFVDILHAYAPIYMTVILCEVLALILFRVSGKLSEQTRYYSNEATNNDLKFAAVKLATHYGDPEDILELAKELHKTERNFILGKDQRTMELASNQMEANHLEQLAEKISVSLKSGKSSNSKNKS